MKIDQPKILMVKDENGNLVVDKEMSELLFGTSKSNWKLVRENDNLVKFSEEIMWLEWQEDGKFKDKHKEPGIGRSLMMSPFNHFFTWQTTPITEILEESDGYLRFQTKNSIYQLSKIEKDEDPK